MNFFKKKFGKYNREYFIKKAPLIISWTAVLASLVFSSWVGAKMVGKTLDAKLSDPGAKPPLPVLVNLDGYENVARRIESARLLTPDGQEILFDPFKPPSKDAVVPN